MSNYYISKCCGEQVEPGGYQDTKYVCQKCGEECEVILTNKSQNE